MRPIFLLVPLLCAMTLPAAPFESLTPFPETVAEVREPRMCLNGVWTFGESATIEVPGEWTMQGHSVPEGTPAVYARTVEIPEDWAGRPAVLRFDAVHAECVVFWDGVRLGEHKGGFVPFELRLPDGGTSPGRHRLRVEVVSASISDTLSTVSQYAAHPVGGILRDVTLVTLPPAWLVSERDVTTLNADGSAVLSWHISGQNAAPGEVRLAAVLRASDGVVAARSEKTFPAAVFSAVFALSVPNPRLWTGETPELYTLEWTFSQNDRPLGSGRRRVGLRTVRVEGNRLLVNGRPVKLMAVNRHEVHPLRGRSLTKAQALEDVRLFKAANVNCVRTSHYPPAPAFLEACDELGLFVECEAALCWVQHSANPVWQNGWDWLDRKYLPYLKGANLDMIRACGGHPSVILWSMGNESCWSPLWAEVLAADRAADPTRPLVFHDQCWGGYNNAGSVADVANFHYPSEANPHLWNEKGRPLWFGEYAHVQCYNRIESETDPGIREDWGRPLMRMVDLMWAQPGCLGGAIWSGIDDVFCLPDGRRVGYGHWGVIDGWRRAKPEFEGLRRAYAPVRVALSEGRVRLMNRHNFLSLNRLDWETPDGRHGATPLTIAPHAAGDIVLPVAAGYRLRVTDARGRVCFDGLYGAMADAVPVPSGRRLPVTLGGDASLVMEGGATLPAPRPCLIPLNATGGAAGPAGSVLSADIPVFTPVERGWTWRSGEAAGTFVGESAFAKGTLAATPQPDGTLLIRYAFTLNASSNPRQWGLVFTLPASADTLRWARRLEGAQPDGEQIGRASGVARARPVSDKPDCRIPPTGPWSADANELGSADFRATRTAVRWLTLGGAGVPTVLVLPETDGGFLPATRAWVAGDAVHLLCAGFSTGGSDGFFSTHYAAERRPLKPGNVIEGAFRLAVLK